MDQSTLLSALGNLYKTLRRQKKEQFERFVSFGNLITDREETARFLGFGEGTTCYENVLVLGDVKVGRHTWIGPNVILDGSGGGLVIGDYCSISAGVQIYTHHTVEWSVSMGRNEYETAPTSIGSGVYIGPQTIIQMGVTVGDKSVIGAMSLVNKNIPSNCRAWGNPAKIIDQ